MVDRHLMRHGGWKDERAGTLRLGLLSGVPVFLAVDIHDAVHFTAGCASLVWRLINHDLGEHWPRRLVIGQSTTRSSSPLIFQKGPRE